MSDRDAAEEVSLKQQLDRIEAKLDRMLGLYDALGSLAAGLPARIIGALHAMSPAEHVALQMVMDGRSNREISVCLDEPEDRVRTWVNGVMSKLGVTGRAEIRGLMLPVMRVIPDAEYEKASGGIPKDWNDRYGVPGVPDPYRKIYHPG